MSSAVVPVAAIDRRVVEATVTSVRRGRRPRRPERCGDHRLPGHRGRLDELLDVRLDRTTARRRLYALAVT